MEQDLPRLSFRRRPIARLLTGTLLMLAVAVIGTAIGIPPASLTALAVLAMFVLSVDIVSGLAGVQTLGHAAMFGAGAYAAGLFSLVAGSSPLLGLFVGTIAGTALALLSAPMILRAEGLVRLALTVIVAELCATLARLAPAAPDLPGPAFLGLIPVATDSLAMLTYTVAALLLVHLAVGLIAEAPLGLSLRALRGNPRRMEAIGAPVFSRRMLAYGIGGGVAGLAGALHAQTTGRIGPELFALALSVEAVILLMIGGRARVWGAAIGTTIAVIAVTLSASGEIGRNAIIGILGLIVILGLPGGIVSLASLVTSQFGDRK